MRLAVVGLTGSGVALCRKLQKLLEDRKGIDSSLTVDLYFKPDLVLPDVDREHIISTPFGPFVGQLFQKYDGIICVMALGIVVRSIAPYIQSKQTDPAVVVMDDLGRHVIPVLSGHLGGANQLACQLAELLRATPIITTSTDLHQVPAFDLIAQEFGMILEGLEDLKYISGSLIDGKPVGLFTKLPLGQELSQRSSLIELEGTENDFRQIKPSHRERLISRWQGIVLITEERISEEILAEWEVPVLILRPQSLVLGLGFRRGKSGAELLTAVQGACESINCSLESIGKIATIDLKGDEPGLKELAQKLQVPVEIYSRHQVREVEELFPGSDFVRQTIGVGAVAEPCAYLSCPAGEWLLRKERFTGITIAIRKGMIQRQEVGYPMVTS